MKRFLILLFLLSLPCALAQNYYNVDELTVDVKITNKLKIIPASPDYSLKKATVYLSYYPKEDYRQRVIKLYTEPTIRNTNGDYVFEWLRPDEDELSFIVDARIMTENTMIAVGEKVDFPIKSIDPELQEYISITPTIDYNNKKIMNLASELAYGEDDLYVVAHKLGDWVNKNIDYDLNTKTADASQKASWVIDNREGVCDELTNLFIGLCRALGIPARFVSGLSYSNLDIFVDRWSPHGWAEVYFPGYGWIPFDVTYGELGFIDPAHIKLKDSLDANRSSTKYEWEGYNVDINTNRLEMETEVVAAGGQWDPLVVLKPSVLKPRVGFGSYDAIVVELVNPHDYYVPTELMLSRSEGIEMFDDFNRYVLLGPRETKKESWIIKLDDRLQKNYVYNFTIKAYTIRNATAKINIISSEDYKVYNLNDIREMVDQEKEEATKTYSRNLGMNCSSGEIYYVNKDVEITCTISNIGNVPLNDLSVCLENDCQDLDLYIGQRTTLGFSKAFTEPGHEDVRIVANNDEVTKTSNVEFVVWGRPTITIAELSYPEYIALDENFSIEFKLSPKTESVPRDVQVGLYSKSFEKKWSLDELEQNRKYILNVDEYTLSDEANDFRIIVTYSDDLGRSYSEKTDFRINLKDVTLGQRVILYLNRINSDAQKDILIISLSLLVAAFMVGLVFRTRKRRRY